MIARVLLFFFFNDTATTEIYTLSLHDALPISRRGPASGRSTGGSARRTGGTCRAGSRRCAKGWPVRLLSSKPPRSEEHTSELQSRQYLVCRLLLEKKIEKKHNYLLLPHILYYT